MEMVTLVSVEAQQLCNVFPGISSHQAGEALKKYGTMEAAAAAILDEGERREEEARNGGAEEPEELAAHIRCPKCFSSDLLEEEQTETIICISCHKHFRLEQAKMGASKTGMRSRGGGKAKKTKKHTMPEKGKGKPREVKDEEVAFPIHDEPDEPADDQSVSSRSTTVRLVVCHASKPKDKRVLMLPRGDEGFDMLLKQARAKFHLKKPPKGARLLHSGEPITSTADLDNGEEVLVTNDSPQAAPQTSETEPSPITTTCSRAASESPLPTSPTLPPTDTIPCNG